MGGRGGSRGGKGGGGGGASVAAGKAVGVAPLNANSTNADARARSAAIADAKLATLKAQIAKRSETRRGGTFTTDAKGNSTFHPSGNSLFARAQRAGVTKEYLRSHGG